MMLQHLQPQAASSRHSTRFLATHIHTGNKKLKWKNEILLKKEKKLQNGKQGKSTPAGKMEALGQDGFTQKFWCTQAHKQF